MRAALLAGTVVEWLMVIAAEMPAMIRAALESAVPVRFWRERLSLPSAIHMARAIVRVDVQCARVNRRQVSDGKQRAHKALSNGRHATPRREKVSQL